MKPSPAWDAKKQDLIDFLQTARTDHQLSSWAKGRGYGLLWLDRELVLLVGRGDVIRARPSGSKKDVYQASPDAGAPPPAVELPPPPIHPREKKTITIDPEEALGDAPEPEEEAPAEGPAAPPAPQPKHPTTSPAPTKEDPKMAKNPCTACNKAGTRSDKVMSDGYHVRCRPEGPEVKPVKRSPGRPRKAALPEDVGAVVKRLRWIADAVADGNLELDDVKPMLEKLILQLPSV